MTATGNEGAWSAEDGKTVGAASAITHGDVPAVTRNLGSERNH